MCGTLVWPGTCVLMSLVPVFLCLALSSFQALGFFLQDFLKPHLGCGAVDLRIGGCMSKLTKGGALGQGAVAKRLARAYTSLKSFCKRRGKTVAIKRFSQDNLNLKSNQFPVSGLAESIVGGQLPGSLSGVLSPPKVGSIANASIFVAGVWVV